MGTTRLTKVQVERLKKAIGETLQARESLLAESDGRLTIQTYPRGEGYDVELTIKTR